jgi:polyisoprenoid-binding protein YceI
VKSIPGLVCLRTHRNQSICFVISALLTEDLHVSASRLVFVLICLWLNTADAQSPYFYTISGTVSFHSEAPQEKISASSTQMQGLIDNEKKTFVFKVIIRSFEGFNSQLQREHFNEKYLESEKYAEALFSGKIIEQFDLNKDGVYPVRAKGKFSIHGVEQERIIKGTLTVKKGRIDLESSFSILLSDYNIKIPKVVHEKVSSEISIEVKAELKKKGPN